MRGRIDAVFGNLIIEFKKDLASGLQAAKLELKKYFQAYLEKNEVHFLGIANDGIHFKVFHPIIENNVVIDVEEIDDLNIEKSTAEQVFLWFDSYFFSTEKIIPTSSDIKRRFGLDSPTFAIMVRKLEVLFENVQTFKPAVIKFESWNKYLEIVYGDKPNEKQLFFKHTYLSILVKLLIHVKITGGRPGVNDEIVPILYGNTFSQAGIKNFIEEDFFSWVLSLPIRKQASKIFKKLLQEIYVYDLEKINEDVLKELYQELVDPDVRKLLGEFYTPDWLAQYIINDILRTKPDARVMDPSCGSGTFLFKTIQYKIKTLSEKGWEQEQILSHIMNNVIGFDIHPLAVIIAKTNYLLALKDILKSKKGHITIPVYLSDSLKIPTKNIDVSTTASTFVFNALDKKFEFPVSIAKDFVKMDSVVASLREYGQDFENTLERSRNSNFKFDSKTYIKNTVISFKKLLSKDYNHEESMLLIRCLNTLYELILEDSDAIWPYVLRNMYKPIAVSFQKTDVILGNPPWLALQFMKNEDYQEFLKLQSKHYGLVDPKKTQNIAHLELATLFFCQTSDLYLKNNGKIAFVMPRSVLVGSQHENFRKFNNIKLEKIYDLEKSKQVQVSPLFKIPSCVLIGTKGKKTQYPVKSIIFNGKLNAFNTQLEDAVHILSEQKGSFEPVVRNENVSYYHKKFSQGATLVPGSFWFVNIKSNSFLGFNPESPLVVSEENKKAKKPWSEIKMENNVERDFLFSTIVSSDIVPFAYRKRKLIVLPVLIENNNAKIISKSSQQEIIQKDISKYLNESENHWQKHATTKSKKMTIYDRINYHKGLTDQHPYSKFKILYVSSATYMTSCVVNGDEDHILLIDGNKLKIPGFFADSTTYCFDADSIDEANYLSSFLNSKFLDEKIKPYQARGSFGGARHIHKIPLSFEIPKYDKNNPKHKKLAGLGEKCHEKSANILPTLSFKSIGKIRSIIRNDLFQEYQIIDGIVKELLETESKEDHYFRSPR